MAFIPEWEFPSQLVWNTSLTYTAKIQNALVSHLGSKPASTRRHTSHMHSQSEGFTIKNIAI